MKQFLLLLLLLNAWTWDTHEALVTTLYYTFPEHIQKELSLTKLQEGSIAPDKDFKDYADHSYPASLDRTEYWLGIMENAQDAGDNDQASYALGVAAHYISDSFSAPHSVSGESYRLHREYEYQGSQKYSFVPCVIDDRDPGEVLKEAVAQGNTWAEWVNTRNKKIPQDALQQAMHALYVFSNDIFDLHCEEQQTTIENREFTLDGADYILLLVLIILLLVTLVSLTNDLLMGSFPH